MLTESKIASLKSKTRKLFCDCDGLYLEVRPSGGRSWIFRDRHDGVLTKKVLGSYPELSLYDARAERDKLRQNVNAAAPRSTVNRRTFESYAGEWMEKKCIPSTTPKHVDKQQSRLNRYVLPALGKMYPSDVTAPMVLAILRDIESRGYTDLAHDVSQLIGMILRYCISCGVTAFDVTAGLIDALAPSRNRHHPSLTRPDDIAQLMRRIYSLPEGGVKQLMLLNIYTFVRPGEARKAEWPEFDLTKAEWHIPAGKMKMRRPHIVPLSRQALNQLKKAQALSGESPYCFKSKWTKDNPISESVLMTTLIKLGYTRDQVSIHGFRSMASTRLNEAGWPVDAIERQLAHVEGNSVRAAYNYAQFLDTRRQMMQWYANYLDALRDGLPVPGKSF